MLEVTVTIIIGVVIPQPFTGDGLNPAPFPAPNAENDDPTLIVNPLNVLSAAGAELESAPFAANQFAAA